MANKENYNTERIKKVLDSEIGTELKRYLIDNAKELNRLSNIKDLSDPLEQTIELKSAKKSFEKFKEIIENILTLDLPLLKERDPRDSYGVFPEERSQ